MFNLLEFVIYCLLCDSELDLVMIIGKSYLFFGSVLVGIREATNKINSRTLKELDDYPCTDSNPYFCLTFGQTNKDLNPYNLNGKKKQLLMAFN